VYCYQGDKDPHYAYIRIQNPTYLVLYAGEAAASQDGLFSDLVAGAAQQHQNTRSPKQSRIVHLKRPIGSAATDQAIETGLADKESILVAIRAARPVCRNAATQRHS